MKSFITTFLVFSGCITANSQTTLYTGDGTLTSNRVVTQSGKNLTFKPTTGNLFINGTTGLVGINTLTPAEQLDVNGNIQGKMGLFTNSQPTQTFASYDDRNYKCTVISGGTLLNSAERARTFQFWDFPASNYEAAPTIVLALDDRAFKTRLSFWATQGSSSKFTLFDKTQNANFLVTDDGANNIMLTMPKANSKVCIGTTSSTDGTDEYSLSVKGNVRANRVKVYNTWADYVFEEDYKLPTLSEVEKYIKQTGHLQDIPSAAEVEAKGIDLGDMNRLLLQKIEELTLYMIEQNKVNAQQAKEIDELKAKVNTLSEKN